MNLTPRLDYTKASPEAVQAMYGLERVIRNSGLDPKIIELVKTRASQINGCAFCVDMHTKDARAHGETEQRLYGLSAWRETPFYSEKERAALAWTEALTNIQQGHAPDAVYEEVKQHFEEKDLMNLTIAITTINAWNRIAIGFRVLPGSYQPAAKAHV
ncbi:carboxymuconolactone decarboxylase family protein [Silvibacterium acidisoli]|uniref:carboxymuconolactone decarboxylase family protein n=1 Tax=Acidobacteriaceae bacterium ZG23-2 TaxID=2883246 RepID=UPI00406C102E